MALPDYFEQLAPELVLLLPPSLSTASLNSLILTCRRLWEILQPDLEARLTPSPASRILYWTAASKPHIIRSYFPRPTICFLTRDTAISATPPCMSPQMPATSRSLLKWEAQMTPTIAALLLDAGANPNAEYDQQELRPLEQAVQKRDFALAALLLDHGAQVDACCGADGASSSVLHMACSRGDREMVDLLLARGAQLECRGHFGTALGFAVRARRLELGRYLLEYFAGRRPGCAARCRAPVRCDAAAVPEGGVRATAVCQEMQTSAIAGVDGGAARGCAKGGYGVAACAWGERRRDDRAYFELSTEPIVYCADSILSVTLFCGS
ncbi:hypothetical protein C8J57DRAFT_1212738 [Mycena rebaudengoi]|nr:hypothetical protein C8J57DRAFT_1212738 [Mycena rebaudengoi]